MISAPFADVSDVRREAARAFNPPPTQSPRRRIADVFVAKFLAKKSSTTPLEWVKVVCEQTMGRLITGRYIWIPQTDVLDALVAAGFRIRTGSDGKQHVGCGKLKVDRFAVLVASKAAHTPQEEV